MLQADITHLAAIGGGVELVLHRMQFNPLARQRQVQGLGLALEGEGDGGAGLAADQFDSVFGAHALGALAIDGQNHVLRLNASLGGWGTFNGGNDHQLFGVLIKAQLDTNPGELPRGVDLHFLELPRVQEPGVGVIQAGEHAPDAFIGFLRTAIGLGQHGLAQFAPLLRRVFAVDIEIVAEDDLPGLIHHLLRAIADQRSPTWCKQRGEGDRRQKPRCSDTCEH